MQVWSEEADQQQGDLSRRLSASNAALEQVRSRGDKTLALGRSKTLALGRSKTLALGKSKTMAFDRSAIPGSEKSMFVCHSRRV